MIRGYWLRCSLDPRLGAMEDMKEVLLEKTSNCYSHDSGGCTIVLTKQIGSEKPRKLRRANIENIFISLKKETVLELVEVFWQPCVGEYLEYEAILFLPILSKTTENGFALLFLSLLH